ncbi:MBL fold metallo-hydrolase [Halorubrum salsamenti]|uniref:MBL fold metallo-hydrolase n=1 Tax=Halorubrum salsamenti TaxID=2583990 RepID=UPI00119FAE19|nr:MBL fold metallo-hydrolase [Halorubrum salsamenti]
MRADSDNTQAIGLKNTVFEGSNTVYLLGADGTGPLTLVDAGFDAPDIRDQLAAGIEATGHAVADVDQILLTHYHGDHAGLAGWVQAESGASIRIHEADAPVAAPDEAAYRDLRDRQEAAFEAWGMPEAKREAVRVVLDEEMDLAAGDPEIEPIADSETVRAGPYDLTALHLPGHTAGHVGYHAADEGALWSGDALLPRYTPNVGGADVRLDGALAAYLGSLERIVDVSPEIAWPGHRDRIDDPVGRAREIVEHHRERTRRVIRVLRERGPANAWAVSHELFGELEAIHILHGPGEASAHLEHLTDHGIAERNDDGTYALVDPASGDDLDLDDLFPDV